MLPVPNEAECTESVADPTPPIEPVMVHMFVPLRTIDEERAVATAENPPELPLIKTVHVMVNVSCSATKRPKAPPFDVAVVLGTVFVVFQPA